MNRARRFQPRHSNLALDLARQAEQRAARRSIPLHDALVDEAYFELKESAAYAAYLETLARHGDTLRGIQTPDVDIAEDMTARPEHEESTNGESL